MVLSFSLTPLWTNGRQHCDHSGAMFNTYFYRALTVLNQVPSAYIMIYLAVFENKGVS